MGSGFLGLPDHQLVVGAGVVGVSVGAVPVSGFCLGAAVAAVTVCDGFSCIEVALSVVAAGAADAFETGSIPSVGVVETVVPPQPNQPRLVSVAGAEAVWVRHGRMLGSIFQAFSARLVIV
jgi:hypothetical protein